MSAKSTSKKDSMQVTTSEFRVSHPHLFKPTAIKGSDKLNYSLEMLFNKKTTDLSSLQAPLKAAMIEKWGANKADHPSPLMLPIRDGDVPKLNTKTKIKEVRAEHKGMWVVRASSSAEYNRPQVVGRDPSIAIQNENEVYAGCYARAALKAFAYEFADKYGVKFIIDAVQFVRDGAPFSGRKAATDLFDVIEGDAGDNSFATNEAADDSLESFM
jgi:hypothetical protein